MATYGQRTGSGAPTNGTSARQTVTLTGSPAGGTFRLKYQTQVTATINYNETNANVQSKLRALSRIGSDGVNVSGSAGGPWTVNFAGALANLNVAPLQVATNSLTGGTSPGISIAETIAGVTATQRGAPAGVEYLDTATGIIYRNVGTTTSPAWAQQTNVTYVPVIGATSNINSVPGSFADAAAVQSYLAGSGVMPRIESRLDTVEAKIDALIGALVNTNIMASS